MCGIVGLFLKDKSLEPELGNMLSKMLVTMTDRGPDSAGIAIYGDAQGGSAKLTVQSAKSDELFPSLAENLGAALGAKVSVEIKDTHAVVSLEGREVYRKLTVHRVPLLKNSCGIRKNLHTKFS